MWLRFKKQRSGSKRNMWVSFSFNLFFTLIIPILLFYYFIRIVPGEVDFTDLSPLGIIFNMFNTLHNLIYYSTVSVFGVHKTIYDLQIIIIFILIYRFMRKYFDGASLSIVDIVIVIILYYAFYPDFALNVDLSVPLLGASFYISFSMIYYLIMVIFISVGLMEILILLQEYKYKSCYHVGYYNENRFITESDVRRSQIINEELKTIDYITSNDKFCKIDKNKKNPTCIKYNMIKEQFDL